MNKIEIFTDGSCNPKTKYHYGGWGVYICLKNRSIGLHGGYWNTTTPRMEMYALLNGLRAINGTVKYCVTIYIDSQFIVNSFKKGWIQKWILNNWVGVKNSDLWKEIIYTMETLKRKGLIFNIMWVRGHGKDLTNDIIYGNNCADSLADYRNQDYYLEDLPTDGNGRTITFVDAIE